MKPATQLETLNKLLKLREENRYQEVLDEVVQIPVSIYTDPAILTRELTTTFKNYPILAGHASHLREPGDYLLSDWNQIPFVIVRDNEGVLRAFLNTCRHRGARLVSGKEDRLKAFICPFHGWAYSLDGSLKTITREYAFPGIQHCDYGLKALPVEEHMGLVWVHPNPEADMDLSGFLGSISEDLQHFNILGFK